MALDFPHRGAAQARPADGPFSLGGPQSYLVMVFRSLAQTLAHDLGEAALVVAARAGLGQVGQS